MALERLKIPVGVTDFSEIRKNGYYYVDKTGLITELIKDEGTQVTLLTRPRRFGKTMAMNMLAYFFDIRKDSKDLFRTLEVANEEDVCRLWMNQYPVLFLSWKDVDGTTFENALNMLKFTLAQFCIEHSYLGKSEKVNEEYKRVFEKMVNRTESLTEVQTSIKILMTMMYEHYERPVILLLDEYDVPMAKASEHGYYKEMLEVMKVMMGISLKDNPYLKFAVVTGCLKIAKESIFTGTNNFVSDTITSSRFNEYFGFTQEEVDRILRDAKLEEHAEKMKRWYDGYHFGTFDVYCPWDVMNYLRDIQYDPNITPMSYWKNTSDNAIIRSFIDFAGNNITAKLETLLSGGCITERIEENLTYDYLHSSEENFWSVLYLTGYLTKMRESELSIPLPDGVSAFQIPNEEIREIFETTVMKWFNDRAKSCDRKRLFDAVWNGEAEILTKEITTLLRMTISYHDYREDFYHAFLAGIFSGAGYMVESNREHGEGRSDLVVFDSYGGRVAIFEAKYSKTWKNLDKDCSRAISQINEKMYDREFEDNYDEVLCYGISFYKKRCLVKKK